jgi:Permuted papain-like amidase enzyme, YaeF/YiiX, C92 family
MKSKNIYYSKYRSQFKDGDILMFKGSGIISSIIKWKTKSAYSHAGIVAWWNERLMVLEAVGSGVKARPISYLLEHYHGSFDYYRTKEEVKISADERRKMITFAQEQLGKEYAIIQSIKFFFRLLLGLKMTRREKTKPAGKFFCSQYVSAVYNAGGYDLEIQFSDKFTTPSQISQSPLLVNVGTIKKDGV